MGFFLHVVLHLHFLCIFSRTSHSSIERGSSSIYCQHHGFLSLLFFIFPGVRIFGFGLVFDWKLHWIRSRRFGKHFQEHTREGAIDRCFVLFLEIRKRGMSIGDIGKSVGGGGKETRRDAAVSWHTSSSITTKRHPRRVLSLAWLDAELQKQY